MNVPRETIAEALLALFTPLNGGSPFQTVTRSPVFVATANPSDMPALYLIHEGEEARQPQALGLTRWVMHFTAEVLLRADPTTNAVNDTEVNAIIDAVEAAIQPKPPFGTKLGTSFGGDAQRLGGIVTNVSLEGLLKIDPKIMGADQMAIMFYIEVLTGI